MYPLILTYGMVRFKLFDTKIIATEILVGTLVVFMIFRILISDTITQQIFDVVMVVFSSILGFFLIRSVRVEVETREKVESLAKMLEQKNAELAELNQRKTEFVSFANHQLRAPLQAINGYTSLLLDGDYGALTQKQNEALQKNLEAGQLMSLTIDDFLNIAKIELNKIEYQKEKRDIRELIDTVAREQRLATEKKGLTLTVKNAPQPLYANIDFNKLKQVISNLLDNSTKYTPTGGITMGVERVENLAKITLTDTGIGIPEGQIEKLFDKFSRASNANQGDNKGTGLGLYVAKQMIEAHQGTIQASSDGPGKGSTFTIRIPLVM
jgi:signal transduction histidine kinase